jgi:hypothetical protein
MKHGTLIIVLFSLFSVSLVAQGFQLNSIKTPGSKSMNSIKNILLGENVIGPRKVVFVGDLVFCKTESGENSKEVDLLDALYSGRIYYEGMEEPFVFENKTPEEIRQLEIIIFPRFLEMPYKLFLDLDVVVNSKEIGNKMSNDAGEYNCRGVINLIAI